MNFIAGDFEGWDKFYPYSISLCVLDVMDRFYRGGMYNHLLDFIADTQDIHELDDDGESYIKSIDPTFLEPSRVATHLRLLQAGC